MKKLVFFLIVLTVFFLTVPPSLAATTSPSLSGIQIYPSDDVWNVRVDTLPLDAKSSSYVNSQSSAHLYMWDDFPINVVDGTTAKQLLKSITYKQYSDNIPYPIPSNAVIQTQDDHHLLIVDKSTDYLYEMYHASKNSDGTYSADVAVSYALSNYALRTAPSVSADAAGLPMLPGLIRYEEVASGSINHALRFAANNLQNTYVWPARGAAGSTSSNTAYPPHGQRFRLKASFDTSKYPAQEKVVLEALKKYGMILADWNGGDSSTFHICAAPDSRLNMDYAAFSSIHLTDFEAVDESSLMINKDSGQARTTGVVPTPTPTPTATPTPVPTSTPTPVPTTISPSSITVTSPNGGESWSAGSTRRITWTSSGSIGSSVKIELMKGSTVVQTILSSTENDGSYSSWTISSGLTGTDYRIRISSTSYPAVADTSNSVFAITAAPVVSNQQEIGIFTVGIWYLDTTGNGIFSRSDTQTSFGTTGDIPVAGDWNADGTTEIGVFRPSTHTFYLDYNGNGEWNGAVTDRAYNMGLTGDTPVAGDWNKDGRTEIGVFRPSTHMFYLDYNGDGTWNSASIDRAYNMGLTGDIPVAGDWNQDGRTNIGVFRPSTHMFYLDYNGDGTWNSSIDRAYDFGINGGIPVSGMWS